MSTVKTKNVDTIRYKYIHLCIKYQLNRTWCSCIIQSVKLKLNWKTAPTYYWLIWYRVQGSGIFKTTIKWCIKVVLCTVGFCVGFNFRWFSKQVSSKLKSHQGIQRITFWPFLQKQESKKTFSRNNFHRVSIMLLWIDKKLCGW